MTVGDAKCALGCGCAAEEELELVEGVDDVEGESCAGYDASAEGGTGPDCGDGSEGHIFAPGEVSHEPKASVFAIHVVIMMSDL